MRGKTISYFMVLLLSALGFWGCTSEDLYMESVTQPGLTLRLEVPAGVRSAVAATTRATEAGSAAENTIESLHIMFYTRSSTNNNGEWAKLDETISVSGNDLPDFTGSGPQNIFLGELPVSEDALEESDVTLLAVVYANYNSVPDPVTAETEFWSEGSLKPLFFAGSAVVQKSGTDSWLASVSLSRQVAKLRVKLGIHSDAVPENLVIDPNSISVSVSGMPDRSPTVADTDEDPGDTFDESDVSRMISRTASASASSLRSAVGSNGTWEHDLVVDSLYMHPNLSADNAVSVTVSMTVSDPVAGTSQEITETYSLTNSDNGYTTTRNTIYTLSVLARSIEGEDKTDCEVSVVEWDNDSINVDAAWGELTVSRTKTVGVLGSLATTPSYDKILTLTTGEGSGSYTITLVSDKNTTANPVATTSAQLYVDGAVCSGNTFTLAPSSSKDIYIALASTFRGAYLRIAQQDGDGTTGLVRYVTVGGADFEIETTNISLNDGGGTYPLTALVYWPENGGTAEPLELTITAVTDASGSTTTTTPTWVTWETTNTSNQYLSIESFEGEAISFTGSVTNGDLSLLNGFTDSRTTANCYIVNAPGTYRLPLVYGNAIVNGSENTSAYQSSAGSGTNFLSNFVDHAGRNITSPYIKLSNNGANVPDGAMLVWQDVDGLVTNLALDNSDNGYLTFTVNTSANTEGNAVVAVTQNGTIVWSWHIWVTMYDPYATGGTTTVTNYRGNTYEFMNKYIGTCDPWASDIRYAYLLVQPTESELEPVLVVIYQSPPSAAGDNTYYQPGRKDPMPGLEIEDGSTDYSKARNKQTYGTYTWSTSGTGNGANPGTSYYGEISTFAGLITQPYVFNTSTTFPNYMNAWNAQLTHVVTSTGSDVDVTPVVKTVYDPCPPDFCVPPVGAFTGFSKTGVSTGSLNASVTTTNEDDYIYLYVNPGNESAGVFAFRAVSYRLQSVNGGIHTDTKQVTLGTSAMNSVTTGSVRPNIIGLVYDEDTRNVQWSVSWADQNNGRCILPIREE